MNAPMESSPELALRETRAWVERAVIGLNLCPFAKGPQVKGLVRYACCEATTPQALRERLVDELRLLVATPIEEVETTLLVHPRVLGDFLDYNDFLDSAESAVEELGLEGLLQIASFHPDYQFAGTQFDDPGNWTNRSPYPTLHLIREESIDRAVAAMPEAENIYEANIETARRLGTQGWEQLRQQCRADAGAGAEPGPPGGPGLRD